MTLQNRFGTVLRQGREELRWSQATPAARVAPNRLYLCEVERGQVVPSLATTDKLAVALELQLSVLVARCEGGLHV